MRTHAPGHVEPARTGASDDAVIDVAGLTKTYEGRRVVDDVELRVDRGEIFGLLGANGAGKTTTVECLQGLRRPDTGRLRVLGLDPVTDRARLRGSIGSQLQGSALPDRLRVGEAVALFARSHRIDPAAHLAQWGLEDELSTSFADLSGGQRQRLFIVLALLNAPRVVFLDELTQGLDPAARRGVWQVIRCIRDQGTTVVLVSHFAEEVEALCDRVAVMSGGRVIDAGTPQQLTDRHASTTRVTFTRPANFAVESVEGMRGVQRIDADGDRVSVVGASSMVAAVCAATLDGTGAGPPDLRVHHANLDQALVTLIGAP